MRTTDPQRIARHWNAGDKGCSRLIMGLKRELEQVRTGELLRVEARDPAATLDVPAWCGMAGHRLISADPPVYVIKRTSDRFDRPASGNRGE